MVLNYLRQATGIGMAIPPWKRKGAE